MPKLSSLASATKSAKSPTGKSTSKKSVKPTRILSKLTVNDSDLESVTESSESGSSSEEVAAEERKAAIIPKKSNGIKKSASDSSSKRNSELESEKEDGDDISSEEDADESSDDELPLNPAGAPPLESKYVDMHRIASEYIANRPAANLLFLLLNLQTLQHPTYIFLHQDSNPWSRLRPPHHSNFSDQRIWKENRSGT